MKILFALIISIFCISASAKEIGHTEMDTCICMRQIVCDSLVFKGKAVGTVFDKIKEYGIPIRSISLGGTSAWTDLERKNNSLLLQFQFQFRRRTAGLVLYETSEVSRIVEVHLV